MATKKYEVGGMTEAESCGKPGKPRCKKTFKSKGKSKETKGSLLGTIGAGLLGGLGGYAAYKKYKEQQKGGATKYQKGGSTQDKKMADLAKRGVGPVPKSTVDGTKWAKNTKAPNAKKYQKGGSAPHGPGSMTHGTVPPMVNETPKKKKLSVNDLVIHTKGAKKAKQNAMKRQLRKHQNGGTPIPPSMTPPVAPQMPAPKPKARIVPPTPKPQISGKGDKGYTRYTGTGKPSINAADFRAKVIEKYGSEEAARAAKAIQKKGGSTYKTGGMVNPNAKLQAAKVAGSKGVKSGVNPKAAASKVARGRSGGTSAAPKTALPKAQKGWSVTDPYKSGKMGEGASATKTTNRKVGGLSVIHGGTRTKTIKAGGMYPGAKGSINVTKTDNEGRETSSKTKYITQKRANRMIDRKRS